ncbi:MAG: hypothetical protein ACLPX8_25390 [Bryobacteraceae bacterium]|jgi:hypothetical protein
MAAMLVAQPRTIPGPVQVNADPSRISYFFQNAMATREVDIAIAPAADAFEEFRFQGVLFFNLAIRQNNIAFSVVQRASW